MNYKIFVGEKIKEAREALGIEQKELASKLEVSVQAANQWEKGKIFPRLDKLVTIAELTGQKLSFFFDVKSKLEPCYEQKSESLSADEKELVQIFRNMNKAGQDCLLELADTMKHSNKYKKSNNRAVVNG
ncbi:MAG: helix-turn-helix transcriptional regulator [Candidatus Bruticola sp.]